ncbi:two-component system sensor histidine kinase NtrB [Paludisphaera soli]|uniref:two-component system sensor histidine kinase NtrB n=1 Tax=Paludisphaera soli TaxID=2712865 RepID=UPI0013EB491A|nr:HAMP domain-containing sensor histidine kinase [Paludisphaera soli]
MAHPLAGTVVAPASEHDAAPPSGPDVARRLREQNAQIAQLAGGLAHEIRNPLSTLSLNLDLLAEDFQEAETPRERRAGARIERLKHEARRLQDILENFLRFARLQDLKPSETDLNAVVEELCDFYEPQASVRGVMVRTHFAPDLPKAALDADAFKQAVLNLMLNAEHAMPDGGELILTTRRDGPFVVLDVIDTGVGMPEETRLKIFDPFYSTKKGGTGLGLPTTRNIIEAHGGSIEVQSVPNRGSRFSIRLPAAGARTAPPRADRAKAPVSAPPVAPGVSSKP